MKSRACELCGKAGGTGMRYAKRAACNACIDKVLDFVITAGMELKD